MAATTTTTTKIQGMSSGAGSPAFDFAHLVLQRTRQCMPYASVGRNLAKAISLAAYDIYALSGRARKHEKSISELQRLPNSWHKPHITDTYHYNPAISLQ